MVMNRIARALTLILGCVLSLSAQQPAELMARAEQILYGSSGATEATFRSVYYDARGAETGRMTGRMYLQRERFRLEYGSIVAVFSGKMLSYHDQDEQTLTISEPTAEELIQVNPLYFLRSRGKGFKAERLPDSKTMQFVGFTPAAGQKTNLRAVEVGFLTKTGVPHQITVRGADGGRLVITIGEVRSRAALPQASFVLSASQFPESEVVDLR